MKLVYLRGVSFILIAALVTGSMYISPVQAKTIDCNDPRLSMNDIQFWNPCDNECESPGGAGNTSLGQNKDYRGDSVFNEAEMEAINTHMPVYVKAADEAKVPWQLIAVMHSLENSLGLDYNSNGQGIFQDYEGRGKYPRSGDATPEAFLSEAIHAGKMMRGKVPGEEDKLASGDPDTVKSALFGYNGRAGIYKKQALDLGFDQAGADRGEGSPYVMNKADEKRDPNYNPTGWGQIKTDGGGVTYPANQHHGGFVMYAALTDGVQTQSSCSSLGSITEGGLTEEQAIKFMKQYGKNPNNFSAETMGEGLWNMSGCGGVGGSNCVSFSAFFMTAFTELGVPSGGAWGDGGEVVDNQVAMGVESGSEIRPFALFAHSEGETMCGSVACGHTGVVLGVHGDTVIVGHASCARGREGKKGEGDGTEGGSGAGFVKVAKKDDLGTLFLGSNNLRFAYPKNVDTNKINEFINM